MGARTRLADLGAPALTLVTVVFEAELPLLDLQARSLARFVDTDVFAEILVLDNTHRGIGARRRERLRADYGRHRDAVRFLRPDEIAPMPTAPGWVSQQVLKLLIAEIVTTPFYLVLDAKNHWVRPTDPLTFLNADGRARGATHGYRGHALESSLVRVLTYLGVEAEPWLDDFAVTHTPVVLETGVVREVVDSVADDSGSFAREFVTARLTEFFLYAGWIVAEHGTLDGHLDGEVVRSATVWPGQRTAAEVARSLRDARALDAPFVSVHRTALARGGIGAARGLVEFWTDRGLFGTRARAWRFVLGFKIRYVVTMGIRRLRITR